jgi:ribosomal RNA assembly protein
MLKRLLIPEERLAVVIGSKGSTKRNIEKNTNTKITIQEDVQIEGEALEVLAASNVISAIGRGFSPKIAMSLLEEENTLIIIELPRDERVLRRVRSRLIGTRGKTRKNIEEYTKTKISIYGKTASVIGSYDDADFAKTSLEKLIKGLSHKSVYKFLEEEKRLRKQKVLE